MAEQIVDFNGESIAFPADMSDAQISAILKNQSAKPRSSFAMGVAEDLRGAEQLAGKAAEQVASGFGMFPNSVSESFARTNENLRLSQLADEEALLASRVSEGKEGLDFARLAGNVASPVGLVLGVGSAKLAAGLGKVAQGAIGGASASSVSPVTSEDYITEKGKQVFTGAGLGVIGQKGIDAASRVLNPLISASEKKLRDLGVTPTIGQTLGGIVQSTEEFIKSLPFVGNVVRNAQEDTYDEFRLGLLNRGLAKVGVKLPKGTSGYDAIQKAFKVKDDKYDEALKGTIFTYDAPAQAKLTNTIKSMSFDNPLEQDTYNSIVKSGIQARLDPANPITGQSFKEMESLLNSKIFQYKKGGVSEQNIASALQTTLDDLKSVFRRQNPEKSSQLRRVDALYRDLTLLEDASKRSQTGKFTPENYNAAVKENAGGRKKRQFGRGVSYNQDMSAAGVEVLGKQEGDLTRQLATGAIGGYGAYLTDPTLLGVLGGVAPLAYTNTGRKAIDKVISARPEVVKRAGEILSESSGYSGGLFGPQALRQYNIEERKKDQK